MRSTYTKLRENQLGFTVLEVVFVVAFFASLLLGASVLTKPYNYEARNRDSERRLSLAQIMETVYDYKRDTGKFPDGITKDGVEIGSEKNQVNLCKVLVPNYLPDIPVDPLSSNKTATRDQNDTCAKKGVTYESGYLAQLDESGEHIMLIAPASEEGPVSLSR